MLPKLHSNQKAIRIIKGVSDTDHYYGVFNKAATLKAMRNLSSSAFKFWCYLNLNVDGYEFGLSFVDFNELTGVGRAAYYSSVKELKEKGYLVEVELYPRL